MNENSKLNNARRKVKKIEVNYLAISIFYIFQSLCLLKNTFWRIITSELEQFSKQFHDTVRISRTPHLFYRKDILNKVRNLKYFSPLLHSIIPYLQIDDVLQPLHIISLIPTSFSRHPQRYQSSATISSSPGSPDWVAIYRGQAAQSFPQALILLCINFFNWHLTSNISLN